MEAEGYISHRLPKEAGLNPRLVRLAVGRAQAAWA